MIILILIAAPFSSLKLTHKGPKKYRTAGVFGLTLVFAFTGVGHFIKTEPIVEMIPSFIPQPNAIIYATGVVEIAAAILVLLHRYKPLKL